MKIALLSFEYPPETGFGGIGTYTWYHARALAKLGHEVHVLAGATEPTALRRSEHDGVQVFRFRTSGLVVRLMQRMDKHRLWWSKNRMETGLSMFRGLRALQREHHYDAVEMPECGGEGALVNNFLDCPTVVKFHSPARLIMSTYDTRKADQALCSMVEDMGIRGAGALTSCSQFLADEVQLKLGVQRKVHVIANGIDLDLFDASEQLDARDKFNLPRDRPIIFFAGRLESRKGIHFCKDIAAEILTRHKVAFVFAGADLFNYMQDTLLPHVNARPLKGSIHYLGKLSLTEVGSCLRQSEIFLIPSVWENCPYSCLEAMAAGRAIVSSDAGGLPELIRDGENGRLAHVDDVPGYIQRLEELLDDADQRRRLGQAARATIEKSYTDVGIAQQTVNLYQSALTGGA